jgi:hypothetical protein
MGKMPMLRQTGFSNTLSEKGMQGNTFERWLRCKTRESEMAELLKDVVCALGGVYLVLRFLSFVTTTARSLRT